MLYRYFDLFLRYLHLTGFSPRSIQAATSRVNEFKSYLDLRRLKSIKRVTYRHLVSFAADFKEPSIHVTKSRVWALHQLYHYLCLQDYVDKNIALKLPYPKIEKSVPDFLTPDELNRMIGHLSERAHDLIGLRNLDQVLEGQVFILDRLSFFIILSTCLLNFFSFFSLPETLRLAWDTPEAPMPK